MYKNGRNCESCLLVNYWLVLYGLEYKIPENSK